MDSGGLAPLCAQHIANRRRGGLVVCRLMGGDLTVASVCGQGSTFMVRLPTLLTGFRVWPPDTVPT
jgi:hypothetical protein